MDSRTTIKYDKRTTLRCVSSSTVFVDGNGYYLTLVILELNTDFNINDEAAPLVPRKKIHALKMGSKHVHGSTHSTSGEHLCNLKCLIYESKVHT